MAVTGSFPFKVGVPLPVTTGSSLTLIGVLIGVPSILALKMNVKSKGIVGCKLSATIFFSKGKISKLFQGTFEISAVALF